MKNGQDDYNNGYSFDQMNNNQPPLFTEYYNLVMDSLDCLPPGYEIPEGYTGNVPPRCKDPMSTGIAYNSVEFSNNEVKLLCLLLNQCSFLMKFVFY